MEGKLYEFTTKNKEISRQILLFNSWVQPIYTLMQLRHMDIVDCNNHVKSASEFFGPSCAVDSLSDIYNPLGDNSDHLCQLCASKVLGQRCTAHDPYSGYQVGKQ